MTYAQGKTGGLLNKEYSQFFAGNIIKTTTDYSYYDTGSNPNYLLKQAQVTTSEEDVLKKVLSNPNVCSNVVLKSLLFFLKHLKIIIYYPVKKQFTRVFIPQKFKLPKELLI